MNSFCQWFKSQRSRVKSQEQILLVRTYAWGTKNQGFGLGWAWGIDPEKLTNALCPMPDLHE
jgi:hypothetical protein